MYIDAWLERREPVLRVLDCETGEELLRWQGAQLHQMLEKGSLSLQDLNDPELPIEERLGLESLDT